MLKIGRLLELNINTGLGFPPEFRVPGSNPEKPGKITIFPGWKTMRKNPEITRKNFRIPTRNPEKFPGFNPEPRNIYEFQPGTRKIFWIPTRNPGVFPGSDPERI